MNTLSMASRWWREVLVAGLIFAAAGVPLYAADDKETNVKKEDWCEIIVPKTVTTGTSLNIEVKYKNIEPEMKLYCDLHYNNSAGHWKGKLAIGGVFTGIKGTGSKTFTIPVNNTKPDIKKVFGVIFLTPKGWNDRVHLVNSPTVEVVKAAAPKLPPVKVKESYLKLAHPRLLFSAADKKSLQAKTKVDSEIWKHVLQQANSLLRKPLTAEQIRKGHQYWRSEYFLAASLTYYLTGEEKYKQAVVEWAKAYTAVDIWGVGWNENLDIPCNWYMYYLSLSYDILYNDLSEAERKTIRDGIVAHCKPVYKHWMTHHQSAPYDQNHTYVPLIALATAGLAFYEDVPEAKDWLALANNMLEKSRKVLTTDGYYYEGTGYWEYAFHWHMRWADLMTRATGRDMYKLPIFAKNYLQVLHMNLPGAPFFFDVGDTGGGAPGRTKKKTMGVQRKHMIARQASALKSPDAQGVFDMLWEKGKAYVDDPAMLFLWHDPTLKGTPYMTQPTFHHFEDMGIVAWRSSWNTDATVCMFKAGPPLGYSAQKTLKELPGWNPNTGHVHPDMGAIWLFGRGAYLVTDTGFTAKKRTRDHNTFLVDDKGIGADYTYWAYRGAGRERGCYNKWAKVKLEKVHLEKRYGYAAGNLSDAYPDELGQLKILRHVLMTKDFVLLLDDLGGAKPHVFTSLLHTDNEITKDGENIYQTVIGDAKLLIYVLSPKDAELKAEKAIVFGGRGPSGGSDQHRGYQLSLKTAQPVKASTYVTLLIPQTKSAPKPKAVTLVKLDKEQATVMMDWGTKKDVVTLDLNWTSGAKTGPVKWK